VQDGTDHGNTQSTVRDPLPRHVIMFYYAQDTTLDMGPTSIIPGSQYYSVDRLGAGSSEHSLGSDLYDNTDEDLARRDAGIQSAGTILSQGLDEAKAEREQRLAGATQSELGAQAEQEVFQEKKLTVPAGTLAIVHHDMLHRATRHVDGCRWRPMIKMGAVRLVEPHLSAPASIDDAAVSEDDFSGPGSELLGEVATWMSGDGSSSSSSSPAPSRSVSELVEHGLATTSEVERLDAACALGKLCRAGSAEALTTLLALLADEEERLRRLAFVALSRAGPSAVPGLLGIVADPPQMEGTTKLTQAYTNKLLGETSWEGVSLDVHIAVDALYCVGQCAIAPDALEGMGPEAWLEMATSVVEGCGAAIDRASAELAEFIATRPPVDGEGLVFYALERRRVLAESCNTIGLVGAEAVAMTASGAAALAVRCCELLHPLACLGTDEASVYANFMYATTVQTNAAQALMRLCSVGSCSDAIVMHAPNATNPDTNGQFDFDNLVGGMVCEAIDRLRSVVCEEEEGGAGRKAGWELTAAQTALWAKVGGELSWPWDMEATRLYEQL
jgi:hypothetical protein